MPRTEPSREYSRHKQEIDDLFRILRPLLLGKEANTGIQQHSMFEELHKIDRDFDRAYSYGDPIDDRVRALGEKTVYSYVRTITKYKNEITPEMLIARENQFSDNVDPMFAFLIRAMCGHEMMTDEVFNKVRVAWCGDDIPDKVGEILNLGDDQEFLLAFERAELSPVRNVKLTILRRMYLLPTLIKDR